MAGAITFNLNFACVNGTFNKSWNENVTPAQISQGESAGVIVTSTTKVAVPLGSLTISTQGMMMFKNLDTTNNIDIGIDNSGTFFAVGSVKPGEVFCLRLKQGQTYQVIAIAGTPNLQYWLLRD